MNRMWRRGWDSNPRYSCPYTAFPVPHLRPLGHPSCDHAALRLITLLRWSTAVRNWRRGEDLNPRGTHAPIRFRVGRLQPGSATPPHWIFTMLHDVLAFRTPSEHRSAKLPHEGRVVHSFYPDSTHSRGS